MNLRENINRLLSEIKVNNPNIFFQSTGEIIDEDEDTIWTGVVPKWDNSRKIYTDYNIDGSHVNLGLYTSDEFDEVSVDEEYIDDFNNNLKKYNISFKSHKGPGYINYWIPKKYFDLPK